MLSLLVRLLAAPLLPSMALMLSLKVESSRAILPPGVDDRLSHLSAVASQYPPTLQGIELERTKVLWAELRDLLEKSANRHPNKYDLEVRLGHCYALGYNLDVEGSWTKAVDHLERAAMLRPQEIWPHVHLGRHYLWSGKRTQAEAAYRKALSLSGSSPLPPAYFGLAVIGFRDGRYDMCIEYANLYLKHYPDDKVMASMRDEAQRLAVTGEKVKTLFAESKASEESSQVVLEGRVLHVQEDPYFRKQGVTVQYMIFDIQRVVHGKFTKGTFIAVFNFAGQKPDAPLRKGFRLKKVEDEDGKAVAYVAYLDPSYWTGSQASIAIALRRGYLCDGPEPGEVEAAWKDLPLICPDMEHLFALNDHGLIINGDLP